jgi:hypothetical protein
MLPCGGVDTAEGSLLWSIMPPLMVKQVHDGKMEVQMDEYVNGIRVDVIYSCANALAR